MTTFGRIQRCFLPAPEVSLWQKDGEVEKITYTLVQKVSYIVQNLICLIAFVILSPATLAYDWYTAKPVSVIRAGDSSNARYTPPKQMGFATSLFQTSGLGTDVSASPVFKGRCDWNQWMQDGHILEPAGFDHQKYFTDILSNPNPYIQMLKEHHVTAHRFSFEWSVLQPEPGGEFDANAIYYYKQFIHKLLQAGITPSVTLNHFVVPDWFHNSKGFQSEKNIETFVLFAFRIIQLFPEVQDWWSFNELGVKAFQQAREVYPTDIEVGSSLSQRVYAAGNATKNMLIAHCQLHKKVQDAKLN